MTTIKRFVFNKPSNSADEDRMVGVVLEWVKNNRSIIAGPAKVGYYGNDYANIKVSVVIPIKPRHLPFLQAEKPEGVKYFTPKAIKTFHLRTS